MPGAAGRVDVLGPPKALAFAFLGVGAWTQNWLDPRGELTPREVGEMFGTLVVDGLKDGSFPAKTRKR
ncbi:hypothetical protein [Amycolatopsis jejuensis]|uniref:hypothetical protein n=1 Tax=Amycolatopsis jejuensis TaxID=330084 RepID=UPI003CCB9945